MSCCEDGIQMGGKEQLFGNGKIFSRFDRYKKKWEAATRRRKRKKSKGRREERRGHFITG